MPCGCVRRVALPWEPAAAVAGGGTPSRRCPRSAVADSSRNSGPPPSPGVVTPGEQPQTTGDTVRNGTHRVPVATVDRRPETVAPEVRYHATSASGDAFRSFSASTSAEGRGLLTRVAPEDPNPPSVDVGRCLLASPGGWQGDGRRFPVRYPTVISVVGQRLSSNPTMRPVDGGGTPCGRPVDTPTARAGGLVHNLRTIAATGCGQPDAGGRLGRPRVRAGVVG